MRIERLVDLIEHLGKMAERSDEYPILEEKVLELSAKEVSLGGGVEEARSTFKTRGEKDHRDI